MNSLKIPKWELKNGKSMKERQHNGQKKRYKRTKAIYKILHIKLKIE